MSALTPSLLPLLNLLTVLSPHLPTTLPLPTIIVVGDQSSGKSSLLSALANVPPDTLFPTGANECTTKGVTRLVLRNEPTVLSNDPPNDNTPTSEWTATVSIQPQSAGTVPCSASITDYNTLRETVRSHTAVIARLGGSAASVSVATRHSLTITLAGPSLPNLTLLDLPGLVRTATKGQSPAIVAQCDALTDYYMAMPGCVVVCAVPANVDVATVEVLGRASVVDKEGGRTFGVVTKADCVDYGKEGETEEWRHLTNVVNNSIHYLPNGWFVTNCSHTQNPDGTRTFVDEAAWFSKHGGMFREMNLGDKIGCQHLASALGRKLVAISHTQLPGVAAKLKRVIEEAELQVKAANTPSPILRQKQLVLAVEKFTNFLSAGMRIHCRERIAIPNLEVSIARRVQESFEKFRARIKDEKPTFDERVEREVEGRRGGGEGRGFWSRVGMSAWMGRVVGNWKEIGEECATEVDAIMKDVCGKILDKVVPTQNGGLGGYLCDVTTKVLARNVEAVLEGVADLVESEQEVFTMNEDKLAQEINVMREKKLRGAIRNAVEVAGGREGEISRMLGAWYREREERNDELLEVLECYWEVSALRFVDNVCMLLNRRVVGERIVKEMSKECLMVGKEGVEMEERLGELFSEEIVMDEARKEAEKKLAGLREAQSLLQEYFEKNGLSLDNSDL